MWGPKHSRRDSKPDEGVDQAVHDEEYLRSSQPPNIDRSNVTRSSRTSTATTASLDQQRMRDMQSDIEVLRRDLRRHGEMLEDQAATLEDLSARAEKQQKDIAKILELVTQLAMPAQAAVTKGISQEGYGMVQQSSLVFHSWRSGHGELRFRMRSRWPLKLK